MYLNSSRSEEEATPQQVATSANGAATQDGLFRSNLTPDDTHELLKAAELNAKANMEEVVKAKYVLGADGARSWVSEISRKRSLCSSPCGR